MEQVQRIFLTKLGEMTFHKRVEVRMQKSVASVFKRDIAVVVSNEGEHGIRATAIHFRPNAAVPICHVVRSRIMFRCREAELAEQLWHELKPMIQDILKR
jgi:hypothetical protein